MIENSKIFDGIKTSFPKNEIDFFWENKKIKYLRTGQLFHSATNVSKEIGFVNRGLLRSYLINENNGKERNIDFYAEEKYVSAFTSFITRKPSSWYIQALEPVEMIIISHQFLETLIQRNPIWVNLILHIYELQILYRCKREKFISHQNSTNRYKFFLEQYQNIESRISFKHVSLFLGIEPETLSRIKKVIST